MISLNTHLKSLETDAIQGPYRGSSVFWHRVFMARPPYKNPGFKIDKVDWRKLLLKKDKESQSSFIQKAGVWRRM